ncbi:hypothetical protein [Rickettsia endosymbiont of Oedothorax gibbosus]|uniref:hypothetical protein n=1 Tax=Rickettsia endosymbiont of Oedothorax gibbosus TaxID=931099 RepID=UPI00202592FA|nr:hypothetical protein [Rickettsia endosymbiont of Oedothorax gibbosus]
MTTKLPIRLGYARGLIEKPSLRGDRKVDEASHKSNQKWIATTYLRGLAMTKNLSKTSPTF